MVRRIEVIVMGGRVKERKKGRKEFDELSRSQ